MFCGIACRLILFYSPTDNDTKNFKDKYIKLAASLRASGVKTGAVNCEKEPALCAEFSAAHLTGDDNCLCHLLILPLRV